MISINKQTKITFIFCPGEYAPLWIGTRAISCRCLYQTIMIFCHHHLFVFCWKFHILEQINSLGKRDIVGKWLNLAFSTPPPRQKNQQKMSVVSWIIGISEYLLCYTILLADIVNIFQIFIHKSLFSSSRGCLLHHIVYCLLSVFITFITNKKSLLFCKNRFLHVKFYSIFNKSI